ncbi:menaquinone-dependent protoporphyrinogen IX dehydrogenase [Marinomonas sp. C2222]|uniref:Protoporphyrinogen IX dehydrogenase [quinone] n=1 Tax=Marinomonas sargassi TaxID=2984494 RepID=A0ABT2YRB0_9GAMM|nr:menaquinone-dependent protoporphyrinogen IX dehydrogenase [Marinomonas sargassi]MCV2402429.1 menaquinone-dependent protoporphyrinogen IX dehydrogenase [Marinomonas sargassi]
MANILIVFSTTDGHTIKICQTILQHLTQAENKVTLVSIDDVTANQIEVHDKVVIGASIRYGKHQKSVAEFVKDNKAQLENKATAFFTVNLVARKPEKCHPETNPYIIKFLAELNWAPNLQGVFAGKLNYAKYGFLDKNMIRFIMWMTKGPTNPKTNKEFTDWDSVKSFAQSIQLLP